MAILSQSKASGRPTQALAMLRPCRHTLAESKGFAGNSRSERYYNLYPLLLPKSRNEYG